MFLLSMRFSLPHAAMPASIPLSAVPHLHALVSILRGSFKCWTKMKGSENKGEEDRNQAEEERESAGESRHPLEDVKPLKTAPHLKGDAVKQRQRMK